MALSFQEQFKLARKKAMSKPKTEAKTKPKSRPVKTEGEIDPQKKANEIFKARKAKKTEEDRLNAPEPSYSAGGRSSTRDKVFKTRALNLDQLVKVRIDHKTEVYVKPGYDLEALKAKYKPKPTNNNGDDLPPKYQF